jgi:hypothetical protein
MTAIPHYGQITGSVGKNKQITHENPSNNCFESFAGFALL